MNGVNTQRVLMDLVSLNRPGCELFNDTEIIKTRWVPTFPGPYNDLEFPEVEYGAGDLYAFLFAYDLGWWNLKKEL